MSERQPTRPLRNRVTPAGELIATEHRGTMYGNRGVLHNDDLVLVRRHQVRRWLVCVLEFRGRHRQVLVDARAEHLGVPGDRPIEVRADDVDVDEASDHSRAQCGPLVPA